MLKGVHELGWPEPPLAEDEARILQFLGSPDSTATTSALLYTKKPAQKMRTLKLENVKAATMM